MSLFRKDTEKPVGSLSTNVHYTLPPTIQGLQSGWVSMFQSSSIVAALFALLQIQLLVFFKEEIGSNIEEESQTGQALLYLTYLALFFSISATMSSLVLTDEMGSIHIRAARCTTVDSLNLQCDQYDEPSGDLLTRFNGGRSSWRWIMKHWVMALVLGYICLVSQLVLYVWCTETNGLKGAVLVIAIITVLPILDLFPTATCLSMKGRRDGSSMPYVTGSEKTRTNQDSRAAEV